MNTQYCKGCDTEKPWSEFTIRADTGKPCTLCKVCRNQRKRKTPEHANGVPRVPEHTEHEMEHDARMNARFDSVLAQLAELRQMIAALAAGAPQRPAADVNIHINTPQPDTEDPHYKSAVAKLMGLNFEALSKQKRGD